MRKFKWVGKNEFIPGVPPRDITEDEARERGVLDLVLKSKLFEEEKEDKSDGA